MGNALISLQTRVTFHSKATVTICLESYARGGRVSIRRREVEAGTAYINQHACCSAGGIRKENLSGLLRTPSRTVNLPGKGDELGTGL